MIALAAGGTQIRVTRQVDTPESARYRLTRSGCPSVMNNGRLVADMLVSCARPLARDHLDEVSVKRGLRESTNELRLGMSLVTVP